jgi:putative FmdB family regulatory protein
MPIYEYSCTACGAAFEQLVRASDVPACPYCESPRLERRMSAAAVGAAGAKSAGSSLPMTTGGGGCCGGGCGCH